MLNNWFNKSDDNQAGRLKQSFDGPSHGSTVELSRPSADLIDEKPQRAITTALSTPHDAVLAELHGREVEADIPGREQLAIEDPHQRRLNNPYPARPDFLTDFSPTSDPLFDPFTGAHIGDLQPGEARQDLGAKSEDELWGHLSKILKLQSDIADRHVKMEGIGLKKPGPTLDKSKEGGINRRPSTSGGREWGEGVADEGVDEEADEEAETKRKREEEFSRLTSKFTGRRDAIDGIMKDVWFNSDGSSTRHSLWHLLLAG
ncbi:hypothetical protein PILCRDRAFT_93724 [Piloderma croceum F 1598]|uniref:Uncharacterized protein n=1 Tax=Piloderma croceum (strain F 1598) TaxID=765440 RepID=A0A0C3B398_PILCF|nr:hypothetical protein PILCRDRAFT_93724 [Piloderma croceum F 1598]